MKITRILLLSVVLLSCEKIEKGFLSDSVYYLENPFTVQQGTTTTSSTLVADGSTNPINVKLLSVRNVYTGESADSMFLRPQTITIFKDAVTQSDSTLALLNAKMQDSTVAPFSINPIGGRLQFTRASLYLDTGRYTIDVNVSNIKGEKTLKNACDIIVTPLSATYTVVYRRVQTTPPDNDADRTTVQENDTYPVDIKYTPSDVSKVIIKWLDKNGKPFNPSTDMQRLALTYPTFHDWDPYYPVVTTDSTMEMEFPKLGIGMPLFTSLTVGGTAWTDGACLSYYRILPKATDINKTLRLTHSIKFLTDGIYEITFHITVAAKI
ncbi:hypothetical protein [Chitinophaga sp.]|uniref:hypothetical protein n=1 Tax=Chitinophaga sp. TaxID=1869181 RepID=UPI0031D52C8E